MKKSPLIKIMSKKGLSLTLLILFSGYLFLIGLGRMALLDPDEPFYAETAREMLKRGEWLTPRIYGQPQFEKPPLYYWLIILSYKIFGVNEFAARFPSALFGILGIIGVYLLGRLLFSEKTALYSSLITATAIEYLILSRACVTDIVLTVSILYFFLFFLYGYIAGKGKVFYLLSSVCLALAVLTKGPVGIILPLFIILLFFLFKKDLAGLFKLPVISGLLVFAVIAVPWFYLMWKAYGAAFTDHFFGFQNVWRFIEPEHKIGDVFYFYVPVIFAGFFPWSAFLPYGIFTIIRRDREKFSSHLILAVWALVFFLFFSASRTKLPTYILPLFPAMGIMLGRFWEIKLNDGETGKRKAFDGWMKMSSLLYIVALTAGFPILYFYCLKKYPDISRAIVITGIPLMIFAAASFWFLIKKRLKLFFMSLVITVSFAALAKAYIMDTPVSYYESSVDICKELKERRRPGERVGAETDYGRGTAFYLEEEDITDVHPHHVIIKFLDSKERVWCVIKEKNHIQLYTTGKDPYTKPTYVVYKLGKRAIITNKIPDDGKFIKKRSPSEPN